MTFSLLAGFEPIIEFPRWCHSKPNTLHFDQLRSSKKLCAVLDVAGKWRGTIGCVCIEFTPIHECMAVAIE